MHPPDPGSTRVSKLLYVTRETRDRHDIARHLHGWGVEMEGANTCAKAFARLINAADAGAPIPLVLLDGTRLDFDPIHFAHAVSSDTQLQGTSLVLITTELDGNEGGQLRQAGYSMLLAIPVDKTLLFDSLHVRATQSGVSAHLPRLIERYRRVRSASLPRDILLCEPDELACRTIKAVLQREGHKVFLVNDGEQALQALEECVFDLAIIDMELPLMTGDQVARIYRFTSLERRDMPFMLVTQTVSGEVLAAAREAGIEAVLPRPVEPGVLLETLVGFAHRDLSGKAVLFGSACRGKPDIGSDLADLPALDLSRLKELEALGRDDSFLTVLCEGFLSEIDFLLGQMTLACASGNQARFIENAEALKGSAACIGALALYDLSACACRLPGSDFEAEALPLLSEIESAAATARASLNAYLKRREHTARKN
jgi:two-component system sensor histidine kinase RpfC